MNRSNGIQRGAVGGVVAAMVVACAVTSAAEPPRPIAELAGRAAGTPQRCIPTRQNENLRIADSHTILYGNGRTIWVNRLSSECRGMSQTDVLVVEPLGTQYCRGDRLKAVNPVNQIPSSFCVLGDFVPYTL